MKKTLNIGILTAGFIKWQGGIDFLKNIILGLKNISSKKNIQLHLCFEVNCEQYILNDFKNDFKAEKFIVYAHIKELHAKHELDLLLPSIRTIESKDSFNWIGYIPDCQHKYLPHFFSREEIEKRDLDFLNMANKAKLIIVNSIDAKKDLIKFYKAKKNKIIALPFAPIVENLSYLEDHSNLIKKYKLPKLYFVISNQFWLHKDHATAFRALSLLKNKNVHIICTGELNDYRSKTYIIELSNLIKDLHLTDRVHFLGVIPKIEQLEIIKYSIALIQPTLFEGGPGGGSVYNAISIGAKSIVSNIRINKEIRSNNILFFKAKNHKSLALKMEGLISKNLSLIRKDILIQQRDYFLKTLSNSLKKIIFSYNFTSENYDKNESMGQYLNFSKNFNSFYNQILAVQYNTVIYGYGTIGKTIKALVPDKIVGYVDISIEKHHPKNLKNMQFNKIIISVLGREEEIVKYLVDVLHIKKDKIITFEF